MLYCNKYRIESARLPHWDYRSNGAYFITICTHDRINRFGTIEQGNMTLSSLGVIAEICWHDIPIHEDGVTLADYVVMPNHIHGILIVNDSVQTPAIDNGPTKRISPVVETLHATSLPTAATFLPISMHEKMSIMSPKPDSISTIIRSFKSAVSKHAHRLGYKFQWQTRFHDHIIRDSEEYDRISYYI